MIALVEVHEPQYRREDDEYVAVAVILLMRCNIELTRKEFEEGDVDGGSIDSIMQKVHPEQLEHVQVDS